MTDTEQPGEWLPDPEGRYALRWFDGTAFTAQVSDGTTNLVDPDFAPGAPPVAPLAPAPPPAPPAPSPAAEAAGSGRGKLVLLLVALVVVAGGVGAFLLLGGDEDIDPDADQEVVDEVILVAGDLPDGFDEQEVDDEGSNAAADECNEEILGIEADAIDDVQTAEAGPVEFGSAAVQINAEATAFRSADLPARVIDASDDDEYLDCLLERFSEEVEADGITVQSFEVIDAPVEPDGARARSFRVEFEVPSGDAGIDLVAEQHVVLVGRFVVVIEGTARAGDLDQEILEDGLNAMLARLDEET